VTIVNAPVRRLEIVEPPRFVVNAREVAQQLGRRANQLRAERGLSLRDIERRTSMSSGTIGQIMRGEQSANLAQLLELQRVYGLGSIEELLGPMPSQNIV
jgi:hypothetical protein